MLQDEKYLSFFRNAPVIEEKNDVTHYVKKRRDLLNYTQIKLKLDCLN